MLHSSSDLHVWPIPETRLLPWEVNVMVGYPSRYTLWVLVYMYLEPSDVMDRCILYFLCNHSGDIVELDLWGCSRECMRLAGFIPLIRWRAAPYVNLSVINDCIGIMNWSHVWKLYLTMLMRYVLLHGYIYAGDVMSVSAISGLAPEVSTGDWSVVDESPN